jgi:hypothetical protein
MEVAWCTIASFKKLYDEFVGASGGRALTLSVFDHFFTIVANNDYYTIRKRSGGIKVFDSKNTNIQRNDSWNSG